MMREKPISWLPFDSRLLPLDFGLKSPHSLWVKILLAIELSLALVSVVGTLFLVFLPKPNLLPAIPKSIFCQEKKDCILAVRIDRCCDCPDGYLKAVVEADPGLEVYDSRQDYRRLRPKGCRQILCPACAFYTHAFCCDGECQGINLQGTISK